MKRLIWIAVLSLMLITSCETPSQEPSTPIPPLVPTMAVPTSVAAEERLQGSCKSLKEAGLVPVGGWAQGNINYTASRDRDGDGWACE